MKLNRAWKGFQISFKTDARCSVRLYIFMTDAVCCFETYLHFTELILERKVCLETLTFDCRNGSCAVCAVASVILIHLFDSEKVASWKIKTSYYLNDWGLLSRYASLTFWSLLLSNHEETCCDVTTIILASHIACEVSQTVIYWSVWTLAKSFHSERWPMPEGSWKCVK